MTSTDFTQLPLKPELLQNLDSLGYHQMTPIQALSLPPVLAGKDVIGQGKTGSGKTAAFGLGVLNQLDVAFWRVQALVLCPTRELADQVTKSLRALARTQHNVKVLTLCGGMPFGPQVGSLEHGAHIIVGTPGRVEEHVRKGKLDLSHLRLLVLDEADRMLDMGFQPSLDAILEQVPARRQTLLFSATYPKHIRQLADRVMQQPVMARVEETETAPRIEQSFHWVANEDERLQALVKLLRARLPESAIVFCRTKEMTVDVAAALKAEGFTAVALNGDLEQKQRDQVLVRFANRSVSILVATDVAARGIDIEALDLVVNYQMALDTEVHLHRIGRTGRADQSGRAATLFSDKERHRLADLESYMDTQFVEQPLPEPKATNIPKPPMVTLQLDAGRKQKLRPGDILGALTGEGGIDGKSVGKIALFDQTAYVAVQRASAKQALAKLSQDKIKGRSVRVRRI
ncbi:MAG: ATP-dependent RNA helicase DbpA [Natronospirillum sp.]|uniref:ATP-dependent RNA helicase DbpA n=1 Tax=Natronospirillum sp. TaxID=2812955 RepID=UPI0025F4EB7A|nr:ATP-dependent RNA helicase DbpA [Natronospirillum sp.]MCH8551252.1 ATP-dependent RNA helicase DbpA [Natronospirillum sp.]